MIGKAMQDAINEQINKELYSSYLYLSMQRILRIRTCPASPSGCARRKAKSASTGMKLYDFLVDRGGRVTLKAIAAPESDWKSPLELFKQVAAHEAAVTASIHGLYETALFLASLAPTEQAGSLFLGQL